MPIFGARIFWNVPCVSRDTTFPSRLVLNLMFSIYSHVKIFDLAQLTPHHINSLTSRELKPRFPYTFPKFGIWWSTLTTNLSMSSNAVRWMHDIVIFHQINGDGFHSTHSFKSSYSCPFIRLSSSSFTSYSNFSFRPPNIPCGNIHSDNKFQAM